MSLPALLFSPTLILFALTSVCQGYDWSYMFSGNDWPGLCSTGKYQSPIDITSKNVMDVVYAQPLVLINYEKPLSGKISWDTHTVKLKFYRPECPVGVAGGGLRGFYLLDHIHFHWSSEHLFESQRLPLEAHFVHYRSSYNNLTEALSDPEGLAVLAVLIVEGEESEGLEDVDEGLSSGKSSIVPGSLLPPDLSQFYRYTGSLTTPPCSETVIWTVFRSFHTALRQQIYYFKNIQRSQELELDNYREVQPLFSREVQLWFTSEVNGAASARPSITLVLLFFGVLLKYLVSREH